MVKIRLMNRKAELELRNLPFLYAAGNRMRSEDERLIFCEYPSIELLKNLRLDELAELLNKWHF